MADGQPLAQVKVELLEEPVPARPPRQVPAEESHGKTQANRVPIEEALYDGNVGPGGMVTTGRGGYTQEAQYSTPDVSKKNADVSNGRQPHVEWLMVCVYLNIM